MTVQTCSPPWATVPLVDTTGAKGACAGQRTLSSDGLDWPALATVAPRD